MTYDPTTVSGYPSDNLPMATYITDARTLMPWLYARVVKRARRKSEMQITDERKSDKVPLAHIRVGECFEDTPNGRPTIYLMCEGRQVVDLAAGLVAGQLPNCTRRITRVDVELIVRSAGGGA
jgi:hypothetical protein